GSLFTPQQAGELVREYCRHQQLEGASSHSDKHIVLDTTLCDALYKGTIKKGEPWPTSIAKAQLQGQAGQGARDGMRQQLTGHMREDAPRCIDESRSCDTGRFAASNGSCGGEQGMIPHLGAGSSRLSWGAGGRERWAREGGNVGRGSIGICSAC
ncbi:hypothetical protein CYMTET_56521, partial [Cymbomonas tetramitiformis]